MFCPHCGTKMTTGQQRFCRECGGEIGAPAQASQEAPEAGAPGMGQQQGGHSWNASSASSAMPPRQPFMLAHVTVKDNTMKTLLIVGALLLLLPLAIPLFFGALLASVFAGFALIGLAFKLAPLIAVAIILYWVMSHRRQAMRAGR